VLRAFEQQPHLARATARQWSEVEQVLEQGAQPTPDPLVALTDPVQVLRLLRLAVNRQESAIRDRKVIDLIAAWALLLHHVVRLRQPELADSGIDRQVRDHIDGVRKAILALLDQNDMREEARLLLPDLFDSGLEALPRDARP